MFFTICFVFLPLFLSEQCPLPALQVISVQQAASVSETQPVAL